MLSNVQPFWVDQNTGEGACFIMKNKQRYSFNKTYVINIFMPNCAKSIANK